MRSENVISIIKREAERCESEARKQGWDGDDYELTAEDCDFIAEAVKDEIDRMPTKAEWSAAGFGWVGNRHYAGEATS